MSVKKILFFSPVQAIEQHAFPEALFAKTLKDEGYEVSYLGCDGLFEDYCLAHSSYGLTENSSIEEKRKVCDMCRRSRKYMSREVTPFLILEDYYDKTHEKIIEDIVKTVTPETIYGLTYQGYPVGRIAAFEFILNYKIFDIHTLNADQVNRYKVHLRNVLRVLVGFQAFLEKHTFDRISVHIQSYSINNIVREVALKKGIPVCFSHPGFNLNRFYDSLFFSYKTTVECTQANVNYFKDHEKDISLDYSQYPLVLDHFKEQLMSNSFVVYSSKRTGSLEKVVKNLGISQKYEKTVLLAMSSTDEAYAADFSFMEFGFTKQSRRVFKDQAEWLKQTIEFFRERPQFKLIIRVHPREFPNKREPIKAPMVQKYEEIFKTIPENISIDYPEMENSIYDLFEIIDLMLVAQSSVGLDAARFGIKTIACVAGLGIYPTDRIGTLPESEKAYFDILGNALSAPTKHSFETAQKTLEWFLYFHTKTAIMFDSQGYWSMLKPSFLQKVVKKLRVWSGLPRFSIKRYLAQTKMKQSDKKLFLDFIQGNREMVEHYTSLKNGSNGISKDQAVKNYFKALYSVYYGGTKMPKDSKVANALAKFAGV